MTADRDPGYANDTARPTSGPERPPRSLSSAVLFRLRRDPALLVPFFLVGVALSLVDRLRRLDPIPFVERERIGSNGINVQVEYIGYPTGATQTAVPLESLIDLHISYLALGIGYYVLPLLAVAVAGAITMRRAMSNRRAMTDDASLWLTAVGPLFGYVVAMDLLYRLLGSIDVLQGMGLWGIVPLILYFLVMVRLFAVPALLVAGRGFLSALVESDRRIRGNGWTVFGATLAIGLTAWLLVDVPVVGTALSIAVVAPAHAVAIVAFLDLERCDGEPRA
ncbi:hypothetical protein ACLI4Z_01260 [Natrialbaceae archaeon A-arb3/5]